jgi:hypothetical protein
VAHVTSERTGEELCRSGNPEKQRGLEPKGRRRALDGVAAMCDYSLEHVASRPARVGDKLVSTRFINSGTRGFAASDEPNVAVCLLPGTELAFDAELKCESTFGFGCKRLPYRVARFREIDKNRPNVHHDALEMPDGQIILVTKLMPGQRATVLQLPADLSERPVREGTHLAVA